MARASAALTAVHTEGGLLPPDLLRRVSDADRDLPGVTPDAYHLASGERLNEAVNRSWNRLTGAWEAFNDRLGQTNAGDATSQLTRRAWLLPLFQELGYGQLQPASGLDVDGKRYPISHSWGRVPIHLLGASIGLDHRTPGVAGAAGMSPHGLVQEFLNRSDDHLWAFVSNGSLLRILRDNVSLTRQAFVEFDLQAIFDGQLYPDFTILWLLCHQSRVEGDTPEKCLLEQWAQEAVKRGTRALEQLRAGVESAITELGAGFVSHPANADLRRNLSSGDLDRQEFYRELLRLVYRLIFLFVAEDRDLLLRPDADTTAAARFREYYSTERLRLLALNRRGSLHSDLWIGLGVVLAGLSSGAGRPELGLPGLGSFLWSADATPSLDGTQIDNRHFLAAIRALASVPDPAGHVVHAVDYRNLGSEELGSIYESLLELHPEIDIDAGKFVLTTAGGHERKTTGSYYTPTSLITELLDSALDPVLADAIAADDPEAAILALTVLDPACGSGHFLIAAAHRIARRLAELRTGDGEPTPGAVRVALRDVVGRCIHGIDVNPMAVELCKVSLWMEAMEPGKPLSFLEHRIVCGNALLGATPRLIAAGIPDEAFKALDGDDADLVKALRKRNSQERQGQGGLLFGPETGELAATVSQEIAALDAMPQDTVDDVRAKEDQWTKVQASSEFQRARLAADAWCAAFVCTKVKGAPPITDVFVRQALTHPASDLPTSVVEEVESLAQKFGFLHPHLAFADVFVIPSDIDQASNSRCGWNGGFSLVVGNPPWDRIKFDEKEWFASRLPEIADEPTAARRRKRIDRLATEDPALSEAYHLALRSSKATATLIRESQRFAFATGELNTYFCFLDVARQVSDASGRVGLIIPSAIATDDSTKAFFQSLMEEDLESLYELENHGFFESIGQGHMNRFALVTLNQNRASSLVRFLFKAKTVTEIRDPERTFTLTPGQLALLNPNTLTCPIFTTHQDALLVQEVYERLPVLWREKTKDDDGNTWAIRFYAGLHSGSDSSAFREHSGALPDYSESLPLYEAKMMTQFNHRHGDYGQVMAGRGTHVLPHPSESQLNDPAFRAQPKFLVDRHEVVDRLSNRAPDWLLVWRDTTDARASARTVIAAAIPLAGTKDKLPAVLSELPARSQMALLAVLNSFALDFVTRQKLGGTSLKYYIMKQLPVPSPASLEDELVPGAGPSTEFLASRAIELSYTAWDLAGLARDVGLECPPFLWNAQRREVIRAEVDAMCFHLYGMSRSDVEYVMESFGVVRRRDVAGHDEYRTKRLVLAAFDAMTKAAETNVRYLSNLDPPPCDPSCCHPESTRPDWARPAQGR
jgi:hypothetical protein